MELIEKFQCERWVAHEGVVGAVRRGIGAQVGILAQQPGHRATRGYWSGGVAGAIISRYHAGDFRPEGRAVADEDGVRANVQRVFEFRQAEVIAQPVAIRAILHIEEHRQLEFTRLAIEIEAARVIKIQLGQEFTDPFASTYAILLQ